MTSSWMIVAGFMFAAMGVFVKLGAAQFDSAELAFYRSALSFAMVFAVMGMRGGTVRSKYLTAHILRGILGTTSLIAYFYAITHLPLATAQTLNYTSPIFLAIATTVVLREPMSGTLIAAIVLGFAGVALLLQPNFEEGKEAAAMLGLFSGALSAWAYLAVRTLGRLGEPDGRVVFWFGLVASVICAAWQLATSTFHPVRWDNAWILAGVGACGTLAQLAMTRAYRTGDTLVVGALSYSTIIFATAATLVLWSERLQPLEWLGMAVIVLSGIVAMRMEKREQVEEAGFES
ncbi:MAG: DMT family transporter [Betaproteobacteria bacterium]